MKLVAVSHLASPDAPTGAEKSLAFLAGALSERRHATAVVVPGRWCLSDAVKESGVEVAEIASRACWLVQWGKQSGWKQTLRYLRYRFPDPGYRRMMVWLDRYWPDVVYVNCLPQLKGAAAARALGLPVVWHIREILPPGRRRRWFSRRLRRCASRIVAVSHAVAEWLTQEGLGDMVEVVHNGCTSPAILPEPSMLREKYGLRPTGVLVGYFAQIVRHKGVVDLVRAASRAMAEDPAVGIVIAGAGAPRELDRLQAEIAGSPFSERFVMLPPEKDVWNLLAAVDMVVVPSLWPDPLPRSVMESMAAGRPVVAYRTGGVPEMVVDGETGFMVEPGDVEGLADGIAQLAGDADLRQRLGAAAARRARSDFSFNSHVDRMEQILIECAAAGENGRSREETINERS
jgi:glycosyltransferase involved in cell wall biosynthesis